MRNKNWTPEESALLIKHWQSATDEMLLKLFPDQTMKQLSSHARKLRAHGINMPMRDYTSKNNRPCCHWTGEETSTLIQNWETASEEKLLQLLPRHTMRQCIDAANRLREKGINVPKRHVASIKSWSEHDTRMLIEHWETLPEDELLAKLENKHRTMPACYTQVHRIRDTGVHIPTRSPALNRRNCGKITGVSYYKTRDIWYVRLSFDGMQYCIGFYRDKNDAVALRKLAEEAIEPIRTELRQLSKTKHGPELQEARKEILARGHQILTELKQQFRNELEAAEDV